jgi:hypothetical protein
MNESDLNAVAMAFGKTRRIERLGDTESILVVVVVGC